MADDKITVGLIFSAVDETAKGMAAVLGRAKGLGSSIGSALAAPFKALFSPAMMAGIFNTQAIVGGIGSAVSAVKDLYEAQEESRLAGARLDNVLRNTGFAAGLTGTQIRNLADELQRTTVFDADEVVAASAALASLGSVSGESFRRTILAATDLTAALGGDLQSNVAALGKALANPLQGLNKLSEAGVGFSVSQRGLIDSLVKSNRLFDAQQLILSNVENKFRGAAVGIAGGAGGKIKQLQNAWGDLAETLASVLEPAVSAVLNSMAKGMARIQEMGSLVAEMIQANKARLQGMFAIGLQGVERLTGGFGSVFGKMLGGDASKGIQGITAFLAKLPVYVMIAVRTAQEWLGWLGNEVQQFLSKVVLGIGIVFDRLGGVMKSPMLEELGLTFLNWSKWLEADATILRWSLRGAAEVKVLQEALKRIDEQAKALADADFTVNVDKSLKKLKEFWGFFSGQAGNMVATLGGQISGLASTIRNRLVGGYQEAGKAAAAAAEKARSAWESAASALKAAAETLRGLVKDQKLFGVEGRKDNLAVALAQAEGNKPQQNRLQFDFARDLLKQAKGEQDRETREALIREARGLLQGLRVDQSIIQGPAGDRRRIENQFVRADRMQEDINKARIAEAQAQVDKARAEEALRRQEMQAREQAANQMTRMASTMAVVTRAAGQAANALAKVGANGGAAPVLGGNDLLGIGVRMLGARLGF